MPSILIAAGGTGGHVIPGLTVAKILSHRDVVVQWVGTDAGIESMLVPNASIPLYKIPVRALRGKSLFLRISSLAYLMLSVVSSIVALFKLRPSLVLGMGGYVSGPCGLAAWLLRIPVVIHEQNSMPGLTNRLLAKISNRVLMGYAGAFKETSNVTYTGNPIRQSMLNVTEPNERLKGRTGRLRMLIMGGSQGAKAINTIVPQAIKSMRDGQLFEVVHQTGKNSLSEVTAAYKEGGIEATVFSFTENIAEYFQWADIIIARSGALTVSEIMAAGVASILIPYPYAVDDHQTYNARPLVDAGAAILMEERKLNKRDLSKTLLEFDRHKILAMSLLARGLARPSAAENIVAICLDVIEGKA